MKPQNFKENKFVVICLLIGLGVICRFLPHPANFVPIGAIALFSGLYLRHKISLILPLLAMLLSDIFIGFYSWPIMVSVYVGFAIMGGIGFLVRRNITFRLVGGSVLAGSLIFFVITNFSVWIFGTMYSHDLGGLIQCYYNALPFFRNSLLGDIFYSAVLIGGYEFICWRSRTTYLAKAIK